MDKRRVRYLVKPGISDPRSEFDLVYEVDSSKREILSCILENELDDSLNELERILKKQNDDLDI